MDIKPSFSMIDTIRHMLPTFLIAIGAAVLIEWGYLRWGNESIRSGSYASSFTLLLLSAVLIIFMVRNSSVIFPKPLAFGLKLLAFMRLLKLQTYTGGPEQLGLLFFAVTLGIGIGLGLFWVAAAGGILVFAALIARNLFYTNLQRRRRSEQVETAMLTLTSRALAAGQLDAIQAALDANLPVAHFHGEAAAHQHFQARFTVKYHTLAELTASKVALRQLDPAMSIALQFED